MVECILEYSPRFVDNQNHVAKGRALGEPVAPGPTVNLDRVSHKLSLGEVQTCWQATS